MTLFSLAFLHGIIALSFFSHLPSRSWIMIAISVSFLAWKFELRGRLIFLAALSGFAWCLWLAHNMMSFSLLPAWQGKTLWVHGKIASLPRSSPFHSSFLFQVDRIQDVSTKKRVATFIQLSWPHAPGKLNERASKNLRVGDEWLFPVRLKKIHGTLNPGGFDLEAWAFQNGIRARGTVLEKEKPFFISRHPFFHLMDQLRQHIQSKAIEQLPASRTAPWLLALMIGERFGIPQSEWEILRKTGTNHLMAIAGLHIGFLAGFAHWVMVKIWRRPQWLLLLPGPQAGAFAALLMALFYSSLAGFSIPTQRALVMIGFLLVATLCRRKIPLWQSWSLALLVVLLLNPFSVLSSSFWLSFLTLALIIYGMSGRLATNGNWWKWGRPQWLLAVGLLPLSLWLFMQFSWVSFIANFLAIPWMGFVILPLCLLSVFLLLVCPTLSSCTLELADQALGLLWSLLAWLSQLPWAVWHQSLPSYSYLLAAICAIVILLLPAGFPGRILGLLWLLPTLSFDPVRPAQGGLLFTLLDVGQGLSVVIQTRQHTLVFDTGARLSPESDMGETVLVPFLLSQGVRVVDKLVLSHGDNDHSGGAEALLKQIPVLSIQTSAPLQFSAWSADYCLEGQSWEWDGVHFQFLHPILTALNFNNDSSCVLQVATEGKRILLPGDIEKTAEKILISNPLIDLASDLLVAPHHGSKTSGMHDFIGRVHPQYVLYAIGYQNRYHFPYPGVIRSYRDLGAIQYDTSTEGAMQFYMGKHSLFPINFYRRSQGKYWNTIDG